MPCLASNYIMPAIIFQMTSAIIVAKLFFSIQIKPEILLDKN